MDGELRDALTAGTDLPPALVEAKALDLARAGLIDLTRPASSRDAGMLLLMSTSADQLLASPVVTAGLAALRRHPMNSASPAAIDLFDAIASAPDLITAIEALIERGNEVAGFVHGLVVSAEREGVPAPQFEFAVAITGSWHGTISARVVMPDGRAIPALSASFIATDAEIAAQRLARRTVTVAIDLRTILDVNAAIVASRLQRTTEPARGDRADVPPSARTASSFVH